MSNWGGKRDGAGRPLIKGELSKTRSFRMTDQDWNLLKKKAKSHNLSIPLYIMFLINKD